MNIPPFGPIQPAVLLALEEVMNRLPYLSDLSDDEWDLIQPLIPVHQGVSHPQEVNLREIVKPFVLG